MKQFLLIPGDFPRIRELRGLAGPVLLELLHCDLRGDGLVWPSHTLIAKRLTASRAQVTRALARLEAGGFIARIKRGRSNAYQIAERFLVDSLLRRPARTAKPGQREQRELLLPIIGVQTTPMEASTGVQPTPIERPKIGLDPTPHGVRLSHGRRKKELDSNPASATGTVAAREVEEIIDRVSLARSARPGSESGKARAREQWIAIMGQFVADEMAADAGQFWIEAMKPPDDARDYLNRIDERMRGSDWYRARQAKARARR